MLYSPDLTWFAYARARLGITQQQLANSLGISRSQLAMAETGKRILSESAMAYLEEMHAIAKQLPIPELVTRRRVAGFAALKVYNRIAPKTVRLMRVPAHKIARQRSANNSPLTATPINYTMLQHVNLSHYKAGAIQHTPGITNARELKAEQQQLRCRLQYLQLEQKNATRLSFLFTAYLKGFDIRIACREELLLQYPNYRSRDKWMGEKLFLAWKRSELKQQLLRYDDETMEKRDRLIARLAGELKRLEEIIDRMHSCAVGMEKRLQFAERQVAA
jgi:transcriptional regulator with XRE-family HTH domain